jgi:hypothetical protein
MTKTYKNGIGHIDERDGQYLVSFYPAGHRMPGQPMVRQFVAETLVEARTALLAFSRGEG